MDQVQSLLDTLVDVTQHELNYTDAVSAIQYMLGIDTSNYRAAASSSIYHELDPAQFNTAPRYKTLAVAYAVTTATNNGYDYNQQFIKQGTQPSLAGKLEWEAHKIAVPLYRNHLEQKLQNCNKQYDFLSLFEDVDFCTKFATRVREDSFINDQLYEVYLGGNVAYPQAIAYLYERMRAKLPATSGVALTVTHPLEMKPFTDPAFLQHTPPVLAYWQDASKFSEHFKTDGNAAMEFWSLCLPLEWSTESALQPPSFPAIGTEFNNVFLQSQGLRGLGSSATSEMSTSSDQPWGMGDFPPPPIITTTYGGDLVSWINSQANGGYADVFNSGSPHETEESGAFGGGCFVPGTRVRTDTGELNIEDLGKGMTVLAKSPAQYGILSHEQVKWPVNDLVWVYGLNDDKPFFTPGHVFWTKAGAKAVDPTLATFENPDVHVEQLAVGDVVFRLKDTVYEEVTIATFTYARATCSHVHGLHFRKGAKGGCSYHANGYLVAANYPEITIERLKENFSNLSLKEQKHFGSAIKRLPESLRSVFGPALVQSFESTFTAPPPSLAAHFEHTKARLIKTMDCRHIHGRHLVRSFPLTNWQNFVSQKARLHSHHPQYSSHVMAINGDRELPEISISHGTVLVDGSLVEHARVDAKEIHWSRPMKTGGWEHGMLKTSPDGMFVHGSVGCGPDPSVVVPHANALSSTVHVMSASHSNDYKLESSVQTSTDAPHAGVATYPGTSTWKHFHTIETSLSMTEGGAVKVNVTLPELDRNWNNTVDPLYEATCSVDTLAWTLNATITLIPGMEEFMLDKLLTWKWDDVNDKSPPPPAFYTITLVVNLATNVACGSYTALQSSLEAGITTYEAGTIHAIHAPSSARVSALATRARAAVAASKIEGNGTPLALTTTNLHSISANIHHEPSSATKLLATAFAATDDGDLPMAVLQTLATPADVNLHAQSQNYMIAAAGYWRHGDETKVFGDEKDAIGRSLPDSLKESLPSDQQAFLRDNFSKALLNYGLSRNKDFSTKFDDVKKDKLQFWWTGKSTNCLSHHTQYNAITTVTARLAFNDLIDQDVFKPYVNSTTDYAAKFFHAITDEAILNNLATSVFLGNQNLVNKYCAILNALDRNNRNFDNQLWTLVRDKQFLRLASSEPEFGKDVSEFLQQYLIDLQTKIKNGDPSISADMREEMKTDIDQLKIHLDAKDAVDLAFKMFDATTDLGGNIMAVIDQFKRRPMKNGQAMMAAVLDRLSEVADPGYKVVLKTITPYLKGILMVGLQAATLYFSIGYLMKWKDLSDAQRAVAVLTTVEAVLRSLYEMAQTWKEIRGLAPDSLDFRLRCVRWSRESAGRVTPQPSDPVQEPIINNEKVASVGRIAEDGSVDVSVPPRSTAQQIAEGGATTEADAAASMTKTFSLSSALVEGVMVGVNIATAVMLGIELRDEWDHMPDNILAMDTINLIVTCAQAITGIVAVGMMVAGAELVAVPFVGALVCLAGLVMMLVEQFVPRPKPDPVQDYLNDHGFKFIDALDASPTPQLHYEPPTKSTSGDQVTLTFTITQPQNLSPAPMVKQFFVRVYAGNSETDLFLPPTLDSAKTVTANDITWKIVQGETNFKIDKNNSPGAADHSLLGTVSPVTKAVYDANDSSKTIPGTSVIGTDKLQFSVTGTLNPLCKTMDGQITEILENPPAGTASTDVVWKFEVSS